MPMEHSGLLERVRLFAMPGGPVACRGTWLRQRGALRFSADRPWLSFEAEEWFEGRGVDFRWKARVRMAPGVHAVVVDSFLGGKGALTARLFGLLKVAGSSGRDLDRAEALRGLAELPWRPFAFGEGPGFSFEAPADGQLQVSFDDGATRATVDFDVDREGRVLGGRAERRPRLVGRGVLDTPWSGAFHDYREIAGLRLPMAAEATWQLPEGPFTYWRGQVLDFKVLR
jgi:hypothetical protein